MARSSFAALVIYQLDATIAAINPVGPSLYRMALRCPPVARASLPGNFVHVLTSQVGEPFWRRAYSVHDVDIAKGILEIVFRVVGRGTSMLSKMRKGERLNLVGPLGHGFALPAKEENVALVGGGVGIPPLHFFAKLLIARKRFPPGDIVFFLGMRRKAEHFCLPLLRKLKLRLFPATDDGSLGYRGFVTSCFEEWVKSTSVPPENLRVYTCGPEEMLKEMAALSSRYGFPCQASLETLMPCGVGACMGCIVKVRNTEGNGGFDYVRVCKEGPVFPADRIIWDD